MAVRMRLAGRESDCEQAERVNGVRCVRRL